MNKNQIEIYNAMLGSPFHEVYSVDHVDAAFEFEKVVAELEALKLKVAMSKPICPHCNQVLIKAKYNGYYDSGDYWVCGCEWDPKESGVIKITGAYT